MKEMLEECWKGGCSGLDFLDIKTLLQKAGCLPGRRLPGQRISAIATLPSTAQYPSILRRTDVDSISTAHPMLQRRVKFNLPPSPHDTSSFAASINSDDTNSDGTCGKNDEGERYAVNETTTYAADLATKQRLRIGMDLKVQQIPGECLKELIELGSLDRILLVYTRELGRMSIDNFRPFRSMYFYSVIIYHLGKHCAMDFDEVVNVCESAVVLNNATAPVKSKSGTLLLTPSLLSFLDLGVELTGNLAMPMADGKALASRSSWKDINLARMKYAMIAGHLIANLEEPAVQHCFSQHVSQRCIIRPIYNYMFQQFIATQKTSLPVVSDGLQFQIYNTVQEVMEKVYGPNPPLSYVMYTVLFAIAETNEMIVQSVLSAGVSVSDIRTTVYSEPVDGDGDDASSLASTVENKRLSEPPLSERELIALIDWDFAAVIGYILAQRYHENDADATAMRAKLGALAFGVDLEKGQPFPPLLPLQDTHFHQYVHQYVSTVYGRWPHGFVYMVIDEAIDAYNAIIQDIRNSQI
ncbi:hypothetical protein GGI25_003952 [Coemansia spiralis]|uniref:Uncharacterized protein n=2 Tax=Coemansia TaxID=4863 RepID=A0A9W8KXN3_9FUNG|nr:hypothetical protein BX070DRAFT_57620 [Coemansia spiralis]KAJ1987721.1 hypothetical protein EDC05_005682 [Coemansia umbellata]KAJ2620964.1 hypothetical protein GGI26_004570 [Coemansia sp. RSA 1358]KAJ2675535.1 hypothetical protein GGI25_003952 [Coemansia spiralis]